MDVQGADMSTRRQVYCKFCRSVASEQCTKFLIERTRRSEKQINTIKRNSSKISLKCLEIQHKPAMAVDRTCCLWCFPITPTNLKIVYACLTTKTKANRTKSIVSRAYLTNTIRKCQLRLNKIWYVTLWNNALMSWILTWKNSKQFLLLNLFNNQI